MKTNGNDISIHDHEQGYNVFTRMCDMTFALISNLINKRTGAGMASLMHGFQCWLNELLINEIWLQLQYSEEQVY